MLFRSPATTFAHLDATTVLSRKISELGIYPAVDPLDSTSKILAPEVVGDDAGRHLFKLMSECISPNQWLNIYQNTDDIFIKEIMLDWGAHLFPEGFVK